MYQQRLHEQDASTYAEVDQALDRRSDTVSSVDETEYVPPPGRRNSAVAAASTSALTLVSVFLLSFRMF